MGRFSMLDWISLTLISSVLMGVATIIEKNSLKMEHATAFSSALSLIVALLSFFFIPWVNFNLTLNQIVLLYVTNIMSAYTFLLSARVYKHGALSTSSAAFSSLPMLFIALFAFIFLSEHLTIVQYISIAGMVIATYMLFFTHGKRKEVKPEFEGIKYEYMILLNVIIGAVGTIFGKYLLFGMSAYTFFFMSNIFSAINFAILIAVRYGGLKEIFWTIRTFKMPMVTNSLLAVGYRITYFTALAIAPVSVAQPLRNTIFIIITVIVGGYLFKEEGLKKKLALGLIMILFAYLLAINT